jgi:hypothetical protein
MQISYVQNMLIMCIWHINIYIYSINRISNLPISNLSYRLSLWGVCDLMNWWCLKMHETHTTVQIAMKKQWLWISMTIDEYLWRSISINAYQWISMIMNIYDYQWISRDINEHHWKSMTINEDQWVSTNINEHQCKSLHTN